MSEDNILYGMTRSEAWRNARRRPRSLENRFMLELGPFHDIGFFVGAPGTEQHLITCHKLMLARCSEVFAAMFFNVARVFTYDDEDPLWIPDVQPAAFDTMIDYVYSGELYVEKFDVAWGTMEAAKKYKMADLEDKCRSFLWTRIYPANVWRTLEYARDSDEQQLYDTAFQIMQRRTSKLLEHRSFEKASHESVLTMLEQNELSVCSELEVYEACVRWARNQARQRGFDKVSTRRIRAILKPALPYIRFLTLTAQERNTVIEEEIINESDFENMSESILTQDFCTISERRRLPDHKTFYTIGFTDECCQESIANEYFENTYDVFSVAFSYSGDFLSTQLGVQIPTQIKPTSGDEVGDTYDEDLTILLYDWSDGKMLSMTRFQSNVKYDSVIDVEFDEKVHLKRKRVRKVVKVIFHKSGEYPSRYVPEEHDGNSKDCELRCCPFGDTPEAKLFYKKSYGYVHFCAYTVDSY